MKLLVIIQKTFGDVLLGNSIVDTLKMRFPDAKITFACEEQYKELVENNPNVAEMCFIKTKDDMLFLASASKWDEVYMMQQTSWVDNLWHHSKQFNDGNLLDYYARKLDLDGYIREIRFYPKTIISTVDIKPKTIAMHTTTLVPSKNWDKFNDLAKELIGQGYSVIQVGLKTDTPIIGAVDYREKLSITELYNAIKQCEAFIGLDSGLSYLAATTKTKVICIMGATTPTTSGPWGENVTPILSNTRKECVEQRCHGNCKYNNPCIKTISVDSVLGVLHD